MVFRQPVHVGELVTFLASVNYTGTTSMEIGIKVVTEDIRSKTVRHTNSCFFTMVALGEDGKPVPVPPLNPKPRAAAPLRPAYQRREIRRELEHRYSELRAGNERLAAVQ